MIKYGQFTLTAGSNIILHVIVSSECLHVHRVIRQEMHHEAMIVT